MSKRVLEPAAQENADATAKPPFLYELGLDGGRKVLDDLRAAPIDNAIAASQPRRSDRRDLGRGCYRH